MWRTVKLGEVCELIGGGTPSKRNPKLYGGDIPWATVRDMHSDDLISTEFSINEEGLASSSSKIIPRNNVVIASRVGLGKVCLLRQDTAINQDLRGVIPLNANEVDTQYLFYWFKSVAEKIISAGRGATVQGVTLPFLNSLDLPLPPLAEQQRIVAKLDTAFAEFDRAIEVEQSQLQLLNKVREANLTEKFQALGDECRFLHLSDACTDFSRGKSKHRPRNDEKLYGSIIPFVQTGDISNAPKYLSTYSKMYSEFGVQQSKRWNKGTVCITIAANIAELAILDIDACFPDSVIGAFPNSEITSSEYLFYLLNFFQKKLKGKSKGSAQQNINLATFSDEVFPFPALREQHKIVSEILELETGVEEIIVCKSKKIDALEALKCAILAQELQPREAA